jgi:hypothetical protein
VTNWFDDPASSVKPVGVELFGDRPQTLPT